MDGVSQTNNVEGSMDMKINLQTRYGWMCLAIAALAVSTSGCKSAGFSMPGKNMFGWNRQPDATTLAGNTKVPELPESPAAKYDPAAIASKSGSSAKPASSAYGYGGAGTGAAGAASAQPGGAAIANGYQSGPYPLAATTPAPATTAASTATSGGLPSPYGGTYNGSMAGVSTPSTATGSGDVPLPSSVAAAMSKGAGATANNTTQETAGAGMPALPNATAVGYTNNAPTTAATTAYQLPGGPAAGQTPAIAASNIYTSGASASGPAGLPALPGSNLATTAAPAGAATSSAATSSTVGATSAAGTSPGAYPSGVSTSSYSPGSTGRSTNYDFGQPKAAGGTPGSSASGGTLPLLR